MWKSEFAELHGMSSRLLAHLLNVRYFHHLAPLEYQKTDKKLSTRVIQKFNELWGPPLKTLDL